jgi:hypothetical protein
MFKKPKRKLSKHHRKCRSHGQGKRGNVVLVRDDYHRAYHLLFANHYPWIVAEILNKTWIDPDYQLICVKREGEVKCL